MEPNRFQKLVVIAILVLLPTIFSCDVEKSKYPFVVINVNYSGTVDSVNKLYLIIYAMPNWTSPWLIMSYSSKEVVLPRLNIGTTPLYFEIVHDLDGNGVDSGDVFQGWTGITNMANPLTPLVLPKIDMVLLNFDLDNNGTIP